MAIKTIKIRIKDSVASKELCRMAKAVNFVWNFCNSTGLEAINRRSEWLSGYDFNYLTKGSAKELGLNSATIQLVGMEFAQKRQQFKKIKLRFRGKKSLGWIPFRRDCIKFRNGKIIFNKKEYKVFQPDRLPVGSFKSGEFCQDARGRWYICIPVEYKPIQHKGVGQVGIDLGLKNLATLSSGKKVSNNRYFRMMENRLAKAQRSGKRKLTRTIHAKIKNSRLDFLHKESTKIINDNNMIVVGKLEAKKLTKTKMAKSINDASPSMFKTMLKYKASAHQHVVFLEVNERNTSRTCSVCGEIPDSSPKGLKGLGVREWVCSSCGAAHDRDINAALNILRIGHDTLALK